jgi:hypothetical protein
MIVALAAIIATQGLGGCALSWMKFWYRRNWIFVLLTFLRAFVFIRPQISLAKWIGSFVNYAVFLCIALSVPDLILLLQPRKVFIVMYYLFIFQQLLSAVTLYIIGLSMDSPCDRALIERSNTPAIFLLRKAQNAVLLFHSLHYVSIIVGVKLFEGVKVPMVKLSDKDRFVEEEPQAKEQEPQAKEQEPQAKEQEPQAKI